MLAVRLIPTPSPLVTFPSLLVFLLLCWTFRTDWIIQQVAFHAVVFQLLFVFVCVWGSSMLWLVLHSLNVLLSLNSIPLREYATLGLPCAHVVFVVRNTALRLARHVFVQTRIFRSFGYILRSGWLSHIVILCLTYWGANQLFSTTATPYYIPTSSLCKFQFLHILVHTCCCPFTEPFCWMWGGVSVFCFASP